jgi:hypothetical protein
VGALEAFENATGRRSDGLRIFQAGFFAHMARASPCGCRNAFLNLAPHSESESLSSHRPKWRGALRRFSGGCAAGLGVRLENFVELFERGGFGPVGCASEHKHLGAEIEQARLRCGYKTHCGLCRAMQNFCGSAFR